MGRAGSLVHGQVRLVRRREPAAAAPTGNGWYGWDLNVEQVAQALTPRRAAASRYERPAVRGDLEITSTPSGTTDLATARRYADLGVHRLTLQPHIMEGTAMDELIDAIGSTLVGQV